MGCLFYASVGGPVVTTYTNDNAGLSQMLVSDDGTNQVYTLFGLDLLYQDDGTDVRYMLSDGLGSVRQELVGDEIAYVVTNDPFGGLLAMQGESGTTYGFTGEQEDSGSGLVYLRARYYDPALKVFLSRDPFSGWDRMPASQNGYSYAHNNPVNYTDPTGEFVGVGAAVAACLASPVCWVVGGIVVGFVIWNALHPGEVNIPEPTIPDVEFPDLKGAMERAQAGICTNIAIEVFLEEVTKPGPQTEPEEEDIIIDIYPPDGDDNRKIRLYHYTNYEGLDGIFASGYIKATMYDVGLTEDSSLKDWRGVNFTDISPVEVRQNPEDPITRTGGRYELAHFLFISTAMWAYDKTEYWISVEFDIGEVIPVTERAMYPFDEVNSFNGRFYYIYPKTHLNLAGRKITCGATDDAVPFSSCPPK